MICKARIRSWFYDFCVVSWTNSCSEYLDFPTMFNFFSSVRLSGKPYCSKSVVFAVVKTTIADKIVKYGNAYLAMTMLILQSWQSISCNDNTYIAMTMRILQWQCLFCNHGKAYLAMTIRILQWQCVSCNANVYLAMTMLSCRISMFILHWQCLSCCIAMLFLQWQCLFLLSCCIAMLILLFSNAYLAVAMLNLLYCNAYPAMPMLLLLYCLAYPAGGWWTETPLTGRLGAVTSIPNYTYELGVRSLACGRSSHPQHTQFLLTYKYVRPVLNCLENGSSDA